MKLPLGFSFSGINCGLKPARKDLALVLSDAPCAGAACLTTNKAQAAPIIHAKSRVPSSDLRAVIINSGNANALTGAQGVADVQKVASAVAETFALKAEQVVAASTGVIGVRLAVDKIISALPRLKSHIGNDPTPAAEAIMTTDTRTKWCSRHVKLGGKTATLFALCKGSGMIAPQLATMIAVITTDAAISPELLDQSLRSACERSFNCLTVDNDMSTNDAVFALANGLAKNEKIAEQNSDYAAFCAAMNEVCEDLTKQIAADGEGATKFLEVVVKGALSKEAANDFAKSIAGSPLVKTAIFGADPNWGRILATVGARAGTQGYAHDPALAKVTIQQISVYDESIVAHDVQVLRAKMREPEIRIEVVLKEGTHDATAWGCDFSYDYVKINAEYTSLIVKQEDGTLAKDNRFTNYGPAFKLSLLVEALSYISRLKGQRCVIKYGGAAMVKEPLKQSFCRDINLLRSVGLKPIVVHGGGPEITRTLEKLGTKSHFVDGVRITEAADLKVIEMVLTGSVNTELVTLLNQSGSHAIGISGKDGALLRAQKKNNGTGPDLGLVGEITAVNRDLLEMFLQKDYVPVVSPIGIGEDGQTYNINADDAASAIASALSVDKLIYLTDVAGVFDGDVLISEATAREIEDKLASGAIGGGMKAKTRAILRAIAAGVDKVHIIDGRTPHSIIAELFTDHGIGTLITKGTPS